MFGCHLQDYLRAKQLVSEQQRPLTAKNSTDSDQLWRVYSRFSLPHPAMSSPDVEVNYTRAVVDLLLHVLVPSPHLETHTGRFVVGELITCNVLLPVFAKLSDPDWLNLLIVEVFTKSSNPQEAIAAEPQTSLQPPLPLPTEPELPPQQEARQVLDVSPCCVTQRAETKIANNTAAPELAAYDMIDPDKLNCSLNNAEEEDPTQPFLKHYMKTGKSNPFYQENDYDLDSPLADYKQGSIDSLVTIDQEDGLYDIQRECAMFVESTSGMDLKDICPIQGDSSCPNVLVKSELVEPPDVCGLSLVMTAEGTSNLQDLEKDVISSASNPARELPLGVGQIGVGNPNELTVVSPHCSSSAMPSFSFEALSSPDGPVIIQNLRITGTITAKEHRGTGSHPYTLYTIKVRTLHISKTSANYLLLSNNQR